MISDEVVLPLSGRLYPKRNNGQPQEVNIPLRVDAYDCEKVDYKGLESIF